MFCSPEREKSKATSPLDVVGDMNVLFKLGSGFSSLTLTDVLSSSMYSSPGDFEGLRLGSSRSLSLQLSGVISIGLITPFCCAPATKIGRLSPDWEPLVLKFCGSLLLSASPASLPKGLLLAASESAWRM